MKLLINNSEEKFDYILNLDKNIYIAIIRIAINKLNISKVDIAKILNKSSRTIDNWLKIHDNLANIEIIPMKSKTKDDIYIKLAIKSFDSIYSGIVGPYQPAPTYILSYPEINSATDMDKLVENTMKSGYTIDEVHIFYPQFSKSKLGRIKQDLLHETHQHENIKKYIDKIFLKYKPIVIKTLLPLKFDWDYIKLKQIFSELKYDFSFETLEHIFNNMFITQELSKNNSHIYYDLLDIIWFNLDESDKNTICLEAYRTYYKNSLVTVKGIFELYNKLFQEKFEESTEETRTFILELLKNKNNLHVKIKDLNTKKSNLGESYLYNIVSELHSKYKDKSIMKLFHLVIQKNTKTPIFNLHYTNDQKLNKLKLPFLSKYEIKKLMNIDISKQFNISYSKKRKIFQVKNIHELKFSSWMPNK